MFFRSTPGILVAPAFPTSERTPTVTRLVIVVIATLIGLVASSGASSPAAETTSPNPNNCTSLKRGMTDPIDGRYCVAALQTALRDRGYSQQVTGKFAAETDKNVRDFQRRNNIDPIGVVGPRTQQALFGDTRPAVEPSVPPVPRPSYTVAPCTRQGCVLRLRRSTTQRYAQLLGDHPFWAAGVSSAILGGGCAVVFKTSAAANLCKLVAEGYAAKIQASLSAAARAHGCLRFTLNLVPAKKLLVIDTDNSSRCRD
jgi:Putative peptidoglycan binding domain